MTRTTVRTCVAPLLGVLLLAASCSTPARVPAVPEAAGDHARVGTMEPFIRTWADQISDDFLAELNRATQNRPPEQLTKDAEGLSPAVEFLAISGGGANGAYGAGILAGWTAAGNRPTFELVTGISTGALTAPFAYLGPEYDATLQQVYTTIRTKDVLRERGLIEGIIGDAFTDSKPLRCLIRRYVGADVMAAVAAAYSQGRMLLVGTTNLDAQRGVMWNMGAIAASGHPRALELFQDILVASASIPAASPPVMIDVEVDGRRHQEMHVDGGTVMQVFAYPPSLRLESDRPRRLYVIRNSRLDPQWANVERKSISIASRSIDTLISTQGLGDLYRIYLTCKRDKVDYSLTYIPATFREKPKELFDPAYMSALFDVGYSVASSGSAWTDYPPGFGPIPTTRPATQPSTQPTTQQ